MAASSDCNQNSDPLKLIRVGTSQDQRLADALNPEKPEFPRIDERRIEHAMVFAKAYAGYLRFYGPGNTVTGTWEPFFSRDVSVQLAVAAVQSVDDYRNGVKTSFDFLKSGKNQNSEAELKQHLGYLFSYAGSLAQQLDVLKETLPKEVALKGILQNLVRRQLSLAFKRLIAYYNADLLLAENDRLIADAEPGASVLGARTATFGTVYAYPFSKDWINDNSNSADWQTYAQGLPPDSSVFGSGTTVFEHINAIATHNLFTSIFDQFLKAFARTVSEAQSALAASFTDRDDHEPHYALFVSFLRLFNHVRTETDTLTQRHLDFYYRQILRLKEKPAEPSRTHLLAELAKHADSHEIPEGALFKAGKDGASVDAFFANDRAFIANKAKVTSLKNLYRHVNVEHDTLESANGRLFAAPVADSEDGQGTKPASADQSWHPFFNKVYKEGELDNINMPKAEIGFAVASHYLLLAEGERTVTLTFTVDNIETFSADPADIACLFSGEEGWFDAPADWFKNIDDKQLQLQVKLDGDLPKVAPYSAKIHGLGFKTELPIMRVLLNHRSDTDFIYAALESIRVQRMDLTVNVKRLKTLALGNDFGPIDASKPFQPFGATPVKNSSLVIGSKEAFQKELSLCKLNVVWQATPAPYKKIVTVSAEFLQKGRWQNSGIAPLNITQSEFDLTTGLNNPYTPIIDASDLSEQESYSSAARHGYVRLKTNNDFGQSEYEQALIDYIANQINTEQAGSGNTKNAFVAKPAVNQGILNDQIIIPTGIDLKPTPPTGPFITELTLDYTATQTLVLNSAEPTDFDARKGHFLHLTPFGHAEQHGFFKVNAPDAGLYLLPQFSHINSTQKSGFDPDLPGNQLIRHEAEFYIGVANLKPPQNLALLFQVADGTADPLSDKPDPHIHWSFLGGNEWLPFDEYTIEDATSELLNSGIITLAVPEAATSDNTLMPSGQHWLRASVAKESDAVCRLQKVAAQGFTVTFKNQDNDPSFTATPLAAGTISKLEKPDAAVKGISQPFPSFGGRGAEQASAFYTRISERLRHKDRAITLWDYERLLLQAFPQIFQAKCLNHTHYEPGTGGGNGIYRELAPGHLTVVTIPNLALHTMRDPLRPYTSLGLLDDIEAFLRQRLSGFANPHVENPLFEEVGVSFKVRFHEGYDETFYANQLDEAITRFLSPWAFPGGGNPSFGGKIYRSVLLNFVEEQVYVDYVTDFKLSHSYQRFEDNGAITAIVIADAADVQGSKGVSLLVSARQHSIEVLNPVSETTETTCPCASV